MTSLSSNAAASASASILPGTPKSTPQQPLLNIPSKHVNPNLMMNRGLVQSDILQVYQGAVERAKTDSKALISNSNKTISMIDETKAHIEEVHARVDLR